MVGSFSGSQIGRNKKEKVLNKACNYQKDSYLCNPKQNGSYQTEFDNRIKKIETLKI
jgi:hypothetical protein